MVDRTYHLLHTEMGEFTEGLESIMEPYKTHSTRYLSLLEKMNAKCYTISSTGIRTILTSVAMFPDLAATCQEILDGFADLADIQGELLETVRDINSDIHDIQMNYAKLLRTIMDSCEAGSAEVR